MLSFDLIQSIIQESEKMPARVSRETIYISITAEGTQGKFGQLSGSYRFHCFKNGAAALIREGGKVDGFEKFHPYYLMYQTNRKWSITDCESFEKNKNAGWLILESKGLLGY